MSVTSTPPQDALGADTGGGVAKPQQKRTSRACLVCRARKSKCTLDSQDGAPQPPCARCKKEGKECVIGSSNRGGRRVRRSTVPHADSEPAQWSPTKPEGTTSNAAPVPFPVEPTPLAHMSINNITAPMNLDPALNNLHPQQRLQPPPEQQHGMPGPSGDDVSFNDLQNPSDALDILAHIASNGHGNEHRRSWAGPAAQPVPADPSNQWLDMPSKGAVLNYPPIRQGVLTLPKLAALVERYRIFYHPYFPIVNPESLDPANLVRTSTDEPHLITAILVISSKDLTDEPQIFKFCATHMQALVSALAAGSEAGVEAVEALLVLAEWTPYTSLRQSGGLGNGEEDREAWMHVGTALRVAYFLGLDKYSFRLPFEARDPQAQRKRLAWTTCFISDRQISIRIGRGFWSRGPAPVTTLRKDDFPSLLPQGPGDEDHATIFQATLELTMLFSNVHDVLYSNPSGVRSHLSGGYIKFIDDFRSAIYGWNSVYGTLTCSQNLKATLLMSYDYLRLYTNAFAFHATIQRALPKTKDGKPSFSRVFYNNVGAVGDARFIYEGLDAAKSLLTTMNNFVDPEKSLRYMPLRFYLYTVYAGVFLYRARTVGVMSPEEDVSVRRLVSQTVAKLEAASVGESHPGYRYSRLLKLLWDKVDRKRRDGGSLATIVDPYRPGGIASNTGLGSQSGAGMSTASGMAEDTESPAVTERMGDFSWTDLDAVSNFVVNGNNGIDLDGTDWWTQGFLPADNTPYGIGMDMNMIGGDWNLGMQ